MIYVECTGIVLFQFLVMCVCVSGLVYTSSRAMKFFLYIFLMFFILFYFIKPRRKKIGFTLKNYFAIWTVLNGIPEQ